MSAFNRLLDRSAQIEQPRHDVQRSKFVLKKFPNHADRLARLSIEGRLRHSIAVKNQRNNRGQNHG